MWKTSQIIKSAPQVFLETLIKSDEPQWGCARLNIQIGYLYIVSSQALSLSVNTFDPFFFKTMKSRFLSLNNIRLYRRCTDSAKVGTHRRQHMKADALQKFGFKRAGGKEDCGVLTCKYRFRNMSHFHCTRPTCSYAIVGLAGIEMHAEKHKKGQVRQQRGNR